MTRIFIDGSAGTTGLRIRERLAQRQDISIIQLPDTLRKDTAARRDAINSADIAFLCLPDAAAIEAVSLVESGNVKIIDTSTAHRTNDAWAYGFAELSDAHRQSIAASHTQMNGMTLQETDKIIYPVCSLCRDHQRVGFVEGVKIGLLLAGEVMGDTVID